LLIPSNFLLVKYKGDETTREHLLRLAIEAIEEGGEVGVKAKEICREADIAVTSLYHYFGSRDGLVSEAQAKRYTDSIQDVFHLWDNGVRSCNSKEDFKNLLVQMLDYVMRPERAHARMVRLNVLGSSYARPALRAAIVDAQERVFAAQVTTLDYAREKGWIRQDIDAKAVSAWHLGVITGLTLIELGPNTVNREEWKKIYLNALLETIVAP
jgi:AcrR family transcriptional regulator